jgi:hypothetical protein
MHVYPCGADFKFFGEVAVNDFSRRYFVPLSWIRVKVFGATFEGLEIFRRRLTWKRKCLGSFHPIRRIRPMVFFQRKYLAWRLWHHDLILFRVNARCVVLVQRPSFKVTFEVLLYYATATELRRQLSHI